MPDDARGADSGADSDLPEDSSSSSKTGETKRSGETEASTESAGAVDSPESTERNEQTDSPDSAESAEPADAAESSATGTADNPSDTDTPAPPATRPRRRRVGRLVGWTAAAVVVLLAVAAGTAYGYYQSLQDNVVRHDLDSALKEEERPDKIGDDINILFIGSDGREGGNADYGGRDFVGERSDALMLAHVSPDGEVNVVNFPRDSLVQIPDCDPYGDTEGTAGYEGMINAALFHGGPPCVVKTIESLTDIRIDHFAHLSFVGFRETIDAVGGVEMCLPEAMRDERAELDLDAGRQRLDGEDALSFVRARYDIGTGSDIGRIDRQQMFLGALAEEVTADDLLTDPGEATDMLRSVTEHTGTDEEFDLPTMVSIGSTFADSDLSEIAFYTVPWAQAPLDPNRVVWDEEASSRLFSAVRHDEPVDEGLLVTGDEEDEEEEDGADSADGADSDEGGSEDGAGEASADPAPGASESPDNPIDGRDASSNPCANGLGEGTGGAGETGDPRM